MAATRKQLAKKEVALDGALKTFEDPTKIKPNDFQTLTNLRYRRGGVKAVGGMSTIWAGLGNTANNLFHFRKSYPSAENHILMPVVSGGNQIVYGGTTAIPSAGAIATSLFSSANTGQARFANTPNGGVAYCNGVDAALWYGTKYPVSAFLDWDRQGNTYKYNYTNQVTNSSDNAQQLATVHAHADALDANDIVVLSMEQNGNDDTANGNNFTPGATVAYTQTGVRTGFGYALNLDAGASDYMTKVLPDVDFDFIMTGNWTIDCNIYWGDDGTIWSIDDGTADNRMSLTADFYDDWQQYVRYTLLLVVGGVTVVNKTTSYVAIESPMYNHVTVTCDDSAVFKIYANGYLRTSVTSDSSTMPADPNGMTVRIGCDYASANKITCKIDEFRISDTIRWATTFSIPGSPYGDGGTVAEFYVGSLLPLDRIYFDMDTVNNADTPSTGTVAYWNGGGWTDASAVDSTKSGGYSLGLASGYFSMDGGEVEQSDGISLHKATIIDDLFLYWYRVLITGITDGNWKIKSVHCNSPMQQANELWDGQYRPNAAFVKYTSSSDLYTDYTTSVFEDWFDSQNTATYAELNGLAAGDKDSGDCVLVGSLERLAGFNIGIPGGYGQTAQSAMTVHYWDGKEWQPMNTQDGTSSNGITMSKSGTVSWETVAQGLEYTQNIGSIASSALARKVAAVQGQTVSSGRWEEDNVGENYIYSTKPKLPSSVWSAAKSVNPDVPASIIDLYYYRITFSSALVGTSSKLWVFSVKGIPAQNALRGFKFPLLHDDRLWLCGNTDYEPNAAIYSAPFRPQVFNGEECGKVWFGDNRAIVGAVSFSNQFAATTQKMAMFLKDNEVWKVLGEFPYTVHQVSDTDGLVAPLTLAVSEVEMAAGFKRKVAVWLSQRGVVISDGNTITDISMDVKDLFEPTHTNYLGVSALASARGFVDTTRNEYHLVIPSSSEWVYSFDHGKWFEVDRGSYKLKGGCSVIDTNGASYTYGYTGADAVYRLENGTQNVDEAITCTLRTADFALDNNYITEETTVRGVKVIQRAKESLGANMTLKHYGDSSTTATTMTAINPSKSGYRLDDTARMYRLGPHIFHSVYLQLSSSAQSIPMFEPEFVSILFERAREDVRA